MTTLDDAARDFQESERRIDRALADLGGDIAEILAAAEAHGGAPVAVRRSGPTLQVMPTLIKSHTELMAALLAIVTVVQAEAGPPPPRIQAILQRAGAALNAISPEAPPGWPLGLWLQEPTP